MRLASITVTAPGVDSPAHTGWILHGILGSGRNWRSFARSLATAHPDWGFVLPDLRNHGATGPLPGPHTLSNCVADLDSLPEPDWVAGHSFGGKVALAWAAERGAASGVRHVWVLDSIPGRASDVDSDVLHVLACVESVAMPAADRRDVRAALAARGLSDPIVAWLLTSLEKRADGWHWVYGIDGIHAMMRDYFTRDLAAFLRADRAAGPTVHVVRAGRSDRWTPEVLADLAELGDHARLHTLPNAGHWVHVDDPHGTFALLEPTLAR
jgi:pimeloyl-ACP methyl ester carboxylesterase